MPETLGYHVVKTTFGTWLPGDVRGFWSQDWTPGDGFSGMRRFHDEADPKFEDYARRRMKHAETVLTTEMTIAVCDAIARCVQRSAGGLAIMAAAIEPTHLHLLIPYSARDIETTAKWRADQTTKAVHRQTQHQGARVGQEQLDPTHLCPGILGECVGVH